jgi:hypothetical protein
MNEYFLAVMRSDTPAIMTQVIDADFNGFLGKLASSSPAHGR